jgi:hypothetical protein
VAWAEVSIEDDDDRALRLVNAYRRLPAFFESSGLLSRNDVLKSNPPPLLGGGHCAVVG